MPFPGMEEIPPPIAFQKEMTAEPRRWTYMFAWYVE